MAEIANEFRRAVNMFEDLDAISRSVQVNRLVKDLGHLTFLFCDPEESPEFMIMAADSVIDEGSRERAYDALLELEKINKVLWTREGIVPMVDWGEMTTDDGRPILKFRDIFNEFVGN